MGQDGVWGVKVSRVEKSDETSIVCSASATAGVLTGVNLIRRRWGPDAGAPAGGQAPTISAGKAILGGPANGNPDGTVEFEQLNASLERTHAGEPASSCRIGRPA
jgi:hypothetical protein